MKKLISVLIFLFFFSGVGLAATLTLPLAVGDIGVVSCSDGELSVTSQTITQTVLDCDALPTPTPTDTPIATPTAIPTATNTPTPTDIPTPGPVNLSIIFVADAGTLQNTGGPVAGVGDPVGEWQSQAKVFSVIALNDGKRPIIKSDGPVVPYLSFDGISDVLGWEMPPIHDGNEGTLVIVARLNSDTTAAEPTMFTLHPVPLAGRENVRFRVNPNTNLLRFGRKAKDSGGTTVDEVLLEHPITYGEWFYMIGTWSVGVGEMIMRVNGVEVGRDNVTHPWLDTATQLDIAAKNINGSSRSEVDIAQLELHFEALSLNDMLAKEAEIRNRWNLP